LPHLTSRQGLPTIQEGAEPFKRSALLVIVRTVPATSGLLKRSGSIPAEKGVSTCCAKIPLRTCRVAATGP